MAKALSAKQRAALRKAQLASARKRKGRGKARPVSRKRKIGKYAAIAAGGAAAAGASYYAAKKSKAYARKRKIQSLRAQAKKRVAYRNEMVTLYHRTSTESAKSIVKSQKMHSKTHFKPGDAGDANHIWFANKQHVGLISGVGGGMVSVRVRRGTAQRWHNKSQKFGRNNGWAAVSTSELQRYKIRGPGSRKR